MSVVNLATNPSFEAAAGTSVFRRNLASNPNTGAATISLPVGTLGWNPRWFGGGGSGTTAKVTGAADGPLPGLTAYLRKTWTVGAGPGDTGFSHSGGDSAGTSTAGFPVTAGTIYTVSAYLRPNSAAVGARSGNTTFYWKDSAGNYLSASVGPQITLPNNAWTRVFFTATAPVGAASVGINTDPDVGPNWAVGDTLDGTGLLVEASTVLGAYFDGSTPSGQFDVDVACSWVAAANASMSTMLRTLAAGVGAYSGANAVQSSAWGVNGGKSLRIQAAGTGGNLNAAATVPVNLLAGVAYTIIATVHLDAPLTGTDEGYARRMRLVGAPWAQSPQAPNISGTSQIVWTVTPTIATTVLELWHGGTPGSPDIWWDQLLIVQGAYTGGYFDGNSPAYANTYFYWQGDPATSASVMDVTPVGAADAQGNYPASAAVEKFSIFAYDINTNTRLGELPYTSLTFGCRMNDSGPIAFSVALDSPEATAACSNVLALNGTEFACYVDLNGVIVWGGIAKTGAYQKSTGVQQFGGNDWLSWLDQRIQAKDYSTGTINPVTFIQNVITDLQAPSMGAGASVGLQVATVQGTTQPSITPGYPASQRALASSMVSDMTKIMLPTYGGVDVTVASAWSAAGVPVNTLTVWTPRAGRQASNSSQLFDLDSCIDYNWPTDATKMGTTLIVTGGGSGAATPSQTVQSQLTPVGGLGQSPRLDKVVSYSAIQSPTQISAMANGAAQQYGAPVITPTVTLPTLGLLGTFIAGDDVRVYSAGDSRFPSGLDQYWQVVSYDVTVQDGVASLVATLNAPPQY